MFSFVRLRRVSKKYDDRKVEYLIREFYFIFLLFCFLGRYAFFLESTMNEYVNERMPCDTVRVGTSIQSKGYGIATPRGSDLREAINIAVLELIDNNFLDRLKHKWYYERSECTHSKTKNSKVTSALTMHTAVSIFYLLFFGMGLAIFIAVVEFLLKAKRDSIRLNQNLCKMIRRNLRNSITGIGLPENEEAPNYQMQQQNKTTTTAMESLKSNDPLIINQD